MLHYLLRLAANIMLWMTSYVFDHASLSFPAETFMSVLLPAQTTLTRRSYEVVLVPLPIQSQLQTV